MARPCQGTNAPRLGFSEAGGHVPLRVPADAESTEGVVKFALGRGWQAVVGIAHLDEGLHRVDVLQKNDKPDHMPIGLDNAWHQIQ